MSLNRVKIVLFGFHMVFLVLLIALASSPPEDEALGNILIAGYIGLGVVILIMSGLSSFATPSGEAVPYYELKKEIRLAPQKTIPEGYAVMTDRKGNPCLIKVSPKNVPEGADWIMLVGKGDTEEFVPCSPPPKKT